MHRVPAAAVCCVIAALGAAGTAPAAEVPSAARTVAVGTPMSGAVTSAGADLWRLSATVRSTEVVQLLIDNRKGSGPLTVCVLGPVDDAGIARELAETNCGRSTGPRYAGSADVAAGDRDRLSIPYPRVSGRPLIRVSRASGGGGYAVTIERIIRPTAPNAPTGAITDTLMPLVTRTTRPPRISEARGWFWFWVGGPYKVRHLLAHGGRTLATRTVRTTAARTWRVQLVFDGADRRAMRRMLRTRRHETLRWTMTATDRYGNVARQSVRLSL